jgi:hypothetical protein
MLKEDHTTNNIAHHANPIADATSPETSSFSLSPIPSRRHQKLDVGQHCALYLAGSRAHQHLFQPMGFTAFQCGVSGRRSISDRIEDKRYRRYGSILLDTNNRERNAQCLMWGHDIFLVRITPEMLGEMEIPNGFAITDGVITFRIRPNITIEHIDKAVSRMLANRSVNTFLDTKDGQERMLATGHDPNLRLHTAYTNIGRAPRYSLAEEVYLLRPKREMPQLLQTLAKTLADLIVR